MKAKEMYLYLGRLYSVKGEYKKAIEEYKKALGIDPNYKLAKVNLALIAYMKGSLNKDRIPSPKYMKLPKKNRKVKKEMKTMKYSTGKYARVRHSTAREWDEMEKAKKRSGYQELKHSTGENPAVKHATGVEFDYKALIEESEEKEGISSKVCSKPIGEGDNYLEFYRKSQGKKREENIESTGYKKETKRQEKKTKNKSVKKIIVEY